MNDVPSSPEPVEPRSNAEGVGNRVEPMVPSRLEERRARRAERRERRGDGAWVAGGILILLGLAFLAQNFGWTDLRNWWAIFIFIPAVGSLATAWNLYRTHDGVITPAVRGPLMGGIILTLVALALLFDVNWGIVGPALLILGGIALLLGALRR